MGAGELQVRPARDDERGFIERRVAELWGLPVVGLGRIHDVSAMPALVCAGAGEPLGFATYDPQENAACELVTILALRSRAGVGSALLEGVAREATRVGCRRLWLVTSNDNLDALRFYQRRGLRIAAVHPGAMEAVRALKPGLPATGSYGIPLRDLIELELDLTP
ncbi:MAG TPA: GNAT family N-acetyltransferase [Solirubrobacteraceae bacterium]|nr:GNAT family N-acetyltransferase [Solirubrobacteraceae bacterium]